MNKTDKEHLLKIVEQIEKYVDDIEEMQNKESSKYNNLSDIKKKSMKGRVLENDCWLLQPIHDKLEDALNEFDLVKDLLGPKQENYEMACDMASHYKKEFYMEFEKRHPKGADSKQQDPPVFHSQHTQGD